MELMTKYLDKVEINPESIITFENGIPGFEEEKQFVLLPFDESNPFLMLQSTVTPDLAFIVTNPFLFFPTYEIEIPQFIQELLLIENEEDVTIYTIVTVKDPFETSTANLHAPLVIDQNKKLGKQVALPDHPYHLRHPLNETSIKKEE